MRRLYVVFLHTVILGNALAESIEKTKTVGVKLKNNKENTDYPSPLRELDKTALEDEEIKLVEEDLDQAYFRNFVFNKGGLGIDRGKPSPFIHKRQPPFNIHRRIVESNPPRKTISKYDLKF